MKKTENIEPYKKLLYMHLNDLETFINQHSKNCADEAFNCVLEKLSNNNWKLLTQCNKKAFLLSLKKISKEQLIIFLNQSETYKYKTPLWVIVKGNAWIKTYKLFCFSRLSKDEIISFLSKNYSRDDVVNAIDYIVKRYKDLFFYNIESLQIISQKAKNRYDKNNEYEYAENYVLDKLSENNWHRIRKCSEDKFEQCLKKIIDNLLESYSRDRYGYYYRIPKRVKAKGDLWVAVFKLHCFADMHLLDIVYALPHYSPKKIEKTINDFLLMNIKCGKKTDSTIMSSLDVETNDKHFNHKQKIEGEHPKKKIESLKQIIILETIYEVVFNEDYKIIPEKNNIELNNLIDNLRKKIALKDDERLFLKLRFERGLKIKDAGLCVGWGEKEVYSRNKELINRFLNELEVNDILNQIDKIIHESIIK